MKKLGIISLAVFVFAAVATAAGTTKPNTLHQTANWHHQCVPEPLTMLALIPGVGMLIRRRKKA